MENLRHLLYITLGLLPGIFFGLRFLLQWISSEKKKHSHVPKIFWQLSLCGNVLLAMHYFIQIQYLLFIIQIINGFISWRNLDLLKEKKKKFKIVWQLLCLALITSSLLFFGQSLFLEMPKNILEIPRGLLNEREEISLFWHLFGAMGCILFASRFWIQWIEAEKWGVGGLSKNFWIISIFGSAASLIYFLRTGDWVSTLNYSFGLIPYLRNLKLMMRKSA